MNAAETQDLLAPYEVGPSCPFGLTEAARLLRRTEVGATQPRIEEIVRLGPHRAVDDILALGEFQRSPTRRARVLHRMRRRLALRQELPLLQSWWLQCFSASERPFREWLTLFWHDHFATSWFKVQDTVAMQNQNDALRAGALGSFDDLLAAMVRDPALLLWLDNDQNTKVSGNENFARELLELFALGRGRYDETDVKEAARAFAGWGVRGGVFRLVEADRDRRSKTILGQHGDLGGDDVLDILKRSETSSRFIAAKLYRWLIDDALDEGEEIALGGIFHASDRVISTFVAKLLRSRRFYERADSALRVRSPMEFSLAYSRSLGARFSAPRMVELLRAMGQELYNPPTVDGWKGGRYWIDSATLVARQNFVFEAGQGERGQLAIRDHSEKSTPVSLALMLLGDLESAQTSERSPDTKLSGDSARELASELALEPSAHLL